MRTKTNTTSVEHALRTFSITDAWHWCVRMTVYVDFISKNLCYAVVVAVRFTIVQSFYASSWFGRSKGKCVYVRSSYAGIRAKFYRSCVQCALCSDSVRSHCKLLCLYFVLIFRHRLIAWLEVSTVCGCVFSEWW